MAEVKKDEKVGAKRPADSDEREAKMTRRKLRRQLAETVNRGGYAAGLSMSDEVSDLDGRSFVLCELAGLAAPSELGPLVDKMDTFFTTHPPQSKTVISSLLDATQLLRDRCSCDPKLQGKATCLLLKAPAGDTLRVGATQGAATPDGLAGLPGVERAATDASAGGKEETHRERFLRLSALRPEQILPNLAEYTNAVREIASQAGGLSHRPFFTAALEKVKASDVGKAGEDSADAPDASTLVVGTGASASRSMLWNTRHQTELLLLALAKGQALIEHQVRSGAQKPADVQATVSLLSAAVAGLMKTIGTDGVTHAVAEGMREYAWSYWKSNGYASLLKSSKQPSANSERSNTVSLPKVSKHAGAGKPKETKDAGETPTQGFLVGQPDGFPSWDSPDCKQFFSTAAMHQHPDCGMDQEYWLSRNPLFVWRAMRLLLAQPDFEYTPTYDANDPTFLEKYIQDRWPDLGKEALEAMVVEE
ncbi:hypothetical protein DIPPA_02960 [Diplonema papillatum]|nr:hypothetical protein DIPPA_02960 [Diplonema papillatum]